MCHQQVSSFKYRESLAPRGGTGVSCDRGFALQST
jgi:hypothetical protein